MTFYVCKPSLIYRDGLAPHVFQIPDHFGTARCVCCGKDIRTYGAFEGEFGTMTLDAERWEDAYVMAFDYARDRLGNYALVKPDPAWSRAIGISEVYITGLPQPGDVTFAEEHLAAAVTDRQPRSAEERTQGATSSVDSDQ